MYDLLNPHCIRCKVAGSLRRGKRFVSDIELLFIPKTDAIRQSLFAEDEPAKLDRAEIFINELLARGVINKRASIRNSFCWGAQNKLAIHTASRIPIDFFATTELFWWMALVVKTGGKQNNINLAQAAIARGWRLEAYSSGFRSMRGLGYHDATSEADVYKFVGLPYLNPQNRP